MTLEAAEDRIEFISVKEEKRSESLFTFTGDVSSLEKLDVFVSRVFLFVLIIGGTEVTRDET
jgi:predicted transcriptional regulator